MIQPSKLYSVGGVMLPQPFKIRRLGHVGLWCRDVERARRFYAELLGFKVTDDVHIPLKDGSRYRQVFTTHNGDHHALVLGDAALSAVQNDSYARGVTVNQISFQVGTLREVEDGMRFFGGRNVPINRAGRDSPGSNWAVYAHDPDGHRVELFYGMEQIGWDGRSKPPEMRYLGLPTLPPLPQPSEQTELREARDVRGIDFAAGIDLHEEHTGTFDVGGVRLPRPFKITQVGPVHLFVDDVAASERFYSDELGFHVTERVEYRGIGGVFLRHNSDHHQLGLFPTALRELLGLNSASRLMSLGLAVGSYDQLRQAIAYLRDNGVRFIDAIPPDVHPGIDYAAYFLDPEGHCLFLYHQIEQIGWDGRPRPAEARPYVTADWPETLEATADSFNGHAFMGPLG